MGLGAKPRFALFFGNRGFFPGSLMASARQEVKAAVEAQGYETLMLDADATRFGAVETPAEGAIYARFLKENEGKFDGIILSLPNFGDETGAVAALQHAGVPILIQAYPDTMDRMEPALRRDSFCGKFSIMDVFCQTGVKFTALKPHTAAPDSAAFKANVDHFARVCSVTSAFKGLVVGAIGARTTAFKTVRIDELALQKHGITMETYDLSEVFCRVRALTDADGAVKEKAATLKAYADFSRVPDESFSTITRMGVVFDQIIEENNLDAVAIRCWVEMQREMGISPCVLLSELNNRGVVAACEVDMGNAVAMHALAAASGAPATCLDWNNNYGDDEDKCILFHCGPVPQDLMTGRGTVTNHAILDNAPGINASFGCNVGRIKPQDFSFSSMTTQEGKLKFYVGEGRFTPGPIPAVFFGCAGVAQIGGLQDVLRYIGYNGHRHHVGITPGSVAAPVREALGYYLGYDVAYPQIGE